MATSSAVLVHQERRRIVHLVGADVEMVQEIDDLLLGLELHQRGAVVLAQFAERGPHVAQHFAVVGLGVEAGGAAAEELMFGEELLMHFQSGDQADGLIVEPLDHCSPSFAGRPARAYSCRGHLAHALPCTGGTPGAPKCLKMPIFQYLFRIAP